MNEQIQDDSISIELKTSRYFDSPGNAEIERLNAKLSALRNGTEKQVVLITSSILGEGKSTVAARIARTSARNRKNATLLIDFDLRRPRLHRIFNVAKSRGLADILGLQLPLKTCIKRTSIPNLLLLTSGDIQGNPLNLLKSDKIENFFMEVRSFFDHVIVDSPPVIPVCDSLLLGRVVDNVLFVVKAGTTPKVVVKRAIEIFYDVKVEISGIVLNNVNNVLPYYYDSDYYGYKYYEKPESKTS